MNRRSAIIRREKWPAPRPASLRSAWEGYAALGDSHADGSVDARLYYKPLVTLIWIGALVMALGGSFSFADRRLRIGVARRAAAAIPQAAK